jgi:predicted Zn-dependent protease
MLDRQASLAGGGKLPEWQSTHPDPGNRIRAIEDQLAAVTQGFDGRIIRQNEFFARVDGLVFGENPRLGYFEGGLFLHPDLRFRIEFPQGWRTQNQPDAVAGVSAAQDALMELRIAKGSASAASQEFFSQQGLTAGSVASSALHGNPMVRGEFAANTESGTLRGLASFVEYGGNTYRILTYTPTQKFSSYFNVFRSAHDSFNRLSDAAALNIQPKRVQVERVPRAMTLAQFNQQLPSEISLDLLAIINGVTSETALRAGQMVKRVVR